MAVPIKAAVLATKFARNKKVQGAAAGAAIKATYTAGKATGTHAGKRMAGKAMKQAGIGRKARKQAIAKGFAGPKTTGQQAAAIATSPAGAATIGAVTYDQYSKGVDRRKQAKHPHPTGGR